MDTAKLFESLRDALGQTLPALFGALALLLIGWLNR